MECVRFEAKSDFPISRLPPVRIFVGCEQTQFRAVRVLLASIERLRDPSRAYHVTLMCDLAGFETNGWRTGFTNYRFAVPELAGGHGRAIYNDCDQIYRRDPGELFDLALGNHGLLALETAGTFDSAVMLIDCARMVGLWPRADAQRLGKRALLGRACSKPGFVGPLPETWHVRDCRWDGRSEARLVHYTTLHSQPWQPRPDRFFYREARHAALWRALEATADAAGFQIFSRASPSSAFHARARARRAVCCAPQTAAMECALREVEAAQCAEHVHDFDPFAGSTDEGVRSDCVAISSRLDRVPWHDVPWVLDEAFAAARHAIVARVSCTDANARRLWQQHFEAASRRQPSLHWHLLLCDGEAVSHRRGGRFLGRAEPRVWLLDDATDAESRDTLEALADAFGAKWERPRSPAAVFDVDLVFATGARAAREARRIRRESQFRTRVVGLDLPPKGIDLVFSSRARPRERGLHRFGHSTMAWLAAFERQGRLATPRPQPRIVAALARELAARSEIIPLGDLTAAARRVRDMLAWEGPC